MHTCLLIVITYTSHSGPVHPMRLRDGTPCFSLKGENDWWDMIKRTFSLTLGVRPSVGQVVLRGVLRCFLEMILGSGVSDHGCRYLITQKSFGIHYAFLITTDSVRTCLLVRSLMQYAAASCSETAGYSYTYRLW